jgi:HD-GYP domain-containing protein (c-di-GMP phosphodiesterase class II)
VYQILNLSKPSQLGKIEYDLIKNHPQVGYEILNGIEFPWPVADIVLQHHERLDGSGYPHGISGDAIIREARILQSLMLLKPWPPIGLTEQLGVQVMH